MRQQALYKIIGMQKDVADSSADKQHAYDIHNMRFRHSDVNTLTALINEEGTLKARDADGNIANIKGTVIGFNTLNNQAILFTHEESSAQYVNVITERELKEHRRNPILSSPKDNTNTLCSYILKYLDEVRVCYGDSDVVFEHSGNGVVDIFTEISSLNQPELLINNKVSIRIDDLNSNTFLELHETATSEAVPELEIPVYIDDPESSVPYNFIIRAIIPQQLTTQQVLNGSVVISTEIEDQDNGSTYLSNRIDITVTVPAKQTDPEPDPEPEIEPVYDPVICDYDEESPLLDKCDHIYIITTSKGRKIADNDVVTNVFEYFNGNLGFNLEHPIESTVYFENEDVQKIYWVDGIHQMRYANIAHRNGAEPWSDNLMFDSVPLLHLQEKVTVTRNNTGGLFPSGTVQWACTYMNRYGAESNIFWISPVHYSSPDDRGGAPGETCANSFTITINKYEPKGRFDYIRLYHIVHTTPDAEVAVRRVADIPVPDTPVQKEINGETVDIYPPVVYTDTNTTGEVVDPNELLYLGGISVFPNTLEQKSNTLFLGGLNQQFEMLYKLDLGITQGAASGVEFVNVLPDDSVVPADTRSGYYSHENQLKYSSPQITTFQRGEEYRFGFQAQDKTGKWSDVLWLCDQENITHSPKFDDGKLCPVHATYKLTETQVTELRKNGYRKVRPVAVYPKPWERNIFTGGLLNPTVYNVKDRASNAPFAQSSWFIRPFPPIDISSISEEGAQITDDDGNLNGLPFPETKRYLQAATSDWDGDWKTDMPYLALDSFLYNVQADKFDYISKGSWAEFRHNYPLGDSQQRNGEIQSMYNRRPAGELADNNDSWRDAKYEYVMPYQSRENDNTRNYITRWSDFFYVDQSILTMNSADIEFDQALQATSMDDSVLKITGIIPITSFIASYDITVKTPPNKFFTKDNDSLLLPQGLYNSEIVGAAMEESGFGWKSLINGAYWHDEISWNTIEEDEDEGKSKHYNNLLQTPVGFAVYPWHGSGSLNNDSIGSRKEYPSDKDDKKEQRSNTGDNYISAELKEKVLTNLHYSYNVYGINDVDNAVPVDVKVSTVLDSQQVSLTKIDEPTGSGLGTLHYFGSVDKLITPISDSFISKDENGTASVDNRPLTRRGGYPRMVSYLPYTQHSFGSDNTSHLAFYTPYTPLGYWNTLTGYNSALGYDLRDGADRSMSPISIKYKSCNHIVIALDYKSHYNHYYQPHFGWNVDSETFPVAEYTNPPFWNKSAWNDVAVKLYNSGAFNDGNFNAFGTSSYNYFSPKEGFLYYGQLFRKTPVENRFGGTTPEAVEQNLWTPAGDAVYLTADSECTIEWSVGDTYYQRYDALRTYPFTEEDQNKVIDIVSFMTETHVNIDGRYDKNRGLSNNNHVRPTNFNLLNPVYSQKDNFFTYRTINPKKVNLDVFEYSFTWSLNKVAGALRDEWTRLTFASSYDCDGNKGPLNRIVRLDTQLVAFQEHGVAQILFNETSQVQATDGLPFELANSGKMQGLRYYTTEVGCQNKWSIAVQPNGIYWVDGRTHCMYSLGSDGIQPVSTAKGFATWFQNKNDLSTVWNPGKWQGWFMHSDKTTGELFFTGSDTTLCYDTLLGEFTSFYDYQKTTAMFTVDNTVFTVAPDRSIPDTVINLFDGKLYADHIWMHRANKEHCFIYNKQWPAWIEFICNSNNQGNDYGTDKIFDNLEWRADAWEWNSNWDYKPFVTFDSLNGSDHYQQFAMELNAVNGDASDNNVPQLDNPVKPVNLRKKFKVWHTTMPRAKEQDADGNWVQTRDRIRDTWCHIKLELTPALSNYRHILHDIIVTYFI